MNDVVRDHELENVKDDDEKLMNCVWIDEQNEHEFWGGITVTSKSGRRIITTSAIMKFNVISMFFLRRGWTFDAFTERRKRTRNRHRRISRMKKSFLKKFYRTPSQRARRFNAILVNRNQGCLRRSSGSVHVDSVQQSKIVQRPVLGDSDQWDPSSWR